MLKTQSPFMVLLCFAFLSSIHWMMIQYRKCYFCFMKSTELYKKKKLDIFYFTVEALLKVMYQLTSNDINVKSVKLQIAIKMKVLQYHLQICALNAPCKHWNNAP